MAIQIKNIGTKMVKVEKVFTDMEEAVKYARENSKEVVYKKGKEYLV